MAGGRVCSSSCAFRRDFPPLALSFSVERGTSNSMAKSWNDVPSRSLFSKACCIFSSIASFFSRRTLTRGMVVAVDNELHYCKNGGVICGVSLLRLNASDFLFYPATPPVRFKGVRILLKLTIVQQDPCKFPLRCIEDLPKDIVSYPFLGHSLDHMAHRLDRVFQNVFSISENSPSCSMRFLQLKKIFRYITNISNQEKLPPRNLPAVTPSNL